MSRMGSYDVASYNVIYIYAIEDDAHKGLLKIGRSSLSSSYSIAQLPPNSPQLNQSAHLRIQQQTKTALVNYKLLHTELAVRTIRMKDGSTQIGSFVDDDVHHVLLNSHFQARKFVESGRSSEWFEVDIETAKLAIAAVKQGQKSLIAEKTDSSSFKPAITLRKEQRENVDYTSKILQTYDTMLWNCKMRYGKTVTAYELIKRQGYQKVIVITHRPAVEDSWGSDHDLMFDGDSHLFIDKTKNLSYVYDDKIDYQNDVNLREVVSSGKPFVYFASIQDLRGSAIVGGKYNKNNAVFETDWDMLIVDEAHEGTMTDLGDAVIKALRKAHTKVLLLSGTPYNMLKEFDENKYTWTYVDEQRAKQEWDEEHPNEKNPYEELPRMNIYTFDLSDKIPTSYRYVTEDAAFNFREFFRTWTGDIDKDYRVIPDDTKVGDFVHSDDVYRFLSLISEENADSNYPFSCEEFRDMFAHTFWIVPGVKEAKALSAMIQNHPNFKDFEVVNIAGDGDEEKPYDEALALVKSCIKSYPRTITISCGRLTTGVTVREWTGIMMLSGSANTSAQGYMQAIFRVQSPGVINGKQKTNCYVFDFAPDRTLKVVAEVHRVTNKSTHDDDKAKAALGEFINFCPIIAVEGTVMRTYDVMEMMRQIKRISVENAINSGFDDDTIYISDAGMKLTDFDTEILRRLSDVVLPQKKGKKATDVPVNDHGLTDEKRKLAEKAKRKPKKELTEEEKQALELYKKQKEEQKKLFNLLRAVSIRLPLLFYGADADITEIIHLKDFVNIVDAESWEEFMPKGLKQELFLDILKYYDEDVVVGAGLRIRKLSKAADELPPTLRAKRIVEIMSKFKNPDKETVLTPWRVVNMHMGRTLGGYNFFDEQYNRDIDEPRLIDNGDVTADIFLNSEAKVLEMNSKSGLYPLYLAYSFYMLNVSGKEKDMPLEQAQKIWFDTLDNHIFVLCKTKMARMITIRTLVGYSNKAVHAIYLTKLVEERMKDLNRLANKLTNPNTWSIGGERMKFDAVVGNPPYQGNNHQQIYPYFYLAARQVSGNYVSLIFPTGWQEPKNANNLSKLNNEEIKADRQIIRIDNCQNVFPGISGAEWVNIILWKKGYDNGFDGEQMIYVNGLEPTRKSLPWEAAAVVKPKQILALSQIVIDYGKFESVQTYTSVLKPYGLRTDVFGNYDKYKLPTMQEKRLSDSDIRVIGLRMIRYIPKEYPIPKRTVALAKYKVFVPYAWGNMSETAGLGGAYADIIIASPNDICTETYLESGCFDDFDTAKRHAKYLMTKFARALLFVNKTSQHSTTAWGAVPVQDYTESWWDKSIEEIDEELFKKYNVPQDIIDFVKENIQTKSIDNIICY